jgi:hypothetical protein
VKATKEAVPPQLQGAKSDIRYSIRTSGEEDGLQLYEKARQNLLDINRWQQLAGRFSAAFYLTDPVGKHVQRLPLQGDYIKIHLPANADDKFDWVRIEAIEEQKLHAHFNWIVIRVRPSDPPKQQEETEHFFSKEATSSFCVERVGRKVEASVHGRNELPNVEVPGFMNKLRNIVIALGAMTGLNYPQWKALVRGIVRK